MLIFDFDGTIANTEDWHWFSWNDALSPLGVELTAEKINKYLAHTDFEIMEMIEKDFAVCIADKVSFKDERLQIFMDKYLPKVEPYPYFMTLYQNTPPQEICVISNQRGDVIAELFRICGIKDVRILSAADLNRSKYELIKEEIAANEACCLYEDCNKYLLFAKELGCKTIGIEHQYNRNSLNAADMIIRY